MCRVLCLYSRLSASRMRLSSSISRPSSFHSTCSKQKRVLVQWIRANYRVEAKIYITSEVPIERGKHSCLILRPTVRLPWTLLLTK